jgi:hypothetical protein
MERTSYHHYSRFKYPLIQDNGQHIMLQFLESMNGIDGAIPVSLGGCDGGVTVFCIINLQWQYIVIDKILTIS